LLPRLEELPAALLLAARPAEAGIREGEMFAVLTMDSATEILALAPLSTDGVARLIGAALGSEPEPEFASACRDATGGTPFLVRAGGLEERPLAFVHPMLRAGVYGEIAATDRAAAHAKAARLLAEGHAGEARVAEHLLLTAPAGDAWVVEQLRRAARAAAAAGAPESAVAYLRRAVAEPLPGEVDAGLFLDLGSAGDSAGQA